MSMSAHYKEIGPYYCTIVLVRAVRVAVDRTRLPVRGPASVSNAKMCVQLLIQVH